MKTVTDLPRGAYRHYGAPEPILFLKKVAKAMGSQGPYPAEWQHVDIVFLRNGGNNRDPDARPSATQGAAWRPKDCRFTYVIREAGARHFLIQAVSDAGQVEYELEEGMERPRAVSTISPLFTRCRPAPCDGYEQGDERARRLGVDPLLSLKATFKMTEREILLSYEVENRSARDAYLLTPIILEGVDIDDHDAVYVHLEPNLRTVWLNKRVPTIPEDRDPDDPDFPSQTPLRAGGTFWEAVHVPLPIRERRAYPPMSEHRGSRETVFYDGVRFTLQYYWRTEGMTEEMSQHRSGVARLITRGGVPLKDSDHGFLQTEVIPMQVPVLEVR